MILRRIVVCAILLACAPVCLAEAYTSTCDPHCQWLVDHKFRIAKQLAREGNFEAAAQYYTVAIDAEPLSITSQDASIRAGQCLEKLERFAEAITYYDRAISIANNRPDAQGSKAIVLKRHKRDALFHRAA